MPSNKLRETTSNSRPASRGNAAATLRDSLTGGEIVSGPRASRANKKYIVESESDDEEDDDDDDEVKASDEDEEDEEEDEEEQVEQEEIGGPEESSEDDDEEEDEDADADADADGDADADADADGDIDMDDDADDGQPLPLAQPMLKINGPASKAAAKSAAKPVVTVTPAQDAKVKSVEAKEMGMEEDDEELSELSENDGEDEEGDAGEEGAEAEDVDMEDDESRSPGSRASTPDISKLTKRQRSRLDQVVGNDFLQLPMGMSPYLTFFERKRLADTISRTANEEASYSRRACHATSRNGQTAQESE